MAFWRCCFFFLIAALGLYSASPVGSSLARLRKGDPAALEDIKPGSVIEKILWDPSYIESNNPLNCLVGGEWLYRAHQIRKKLALNNLPQRDPLERSWQLLHETERAINRNSSATSSTISRHHRDAMHSLRMSVSSDMGDYTRMKEALEGFRRHITFDSNVNPDKKDVFNAVAISLRVGDWGLAKKLFAMLDVPEFREAMYFQSMKFDSVPDYGLIAYIGDLVCDADSALENRFYEVVLGPDGMNLEQNKQESRIYQAGALWYMRWPDAGTWHPVLGCLHGGKLKMIGGRGRKLGAPVLTIELEADGNGKWKGFAMWSDLKKKIDVRMSIK